MSFLVSLLPATIFVVIAYFVIYSSARSEGGVKRLGQMLGVWLLFLGCATVLWAALGPMFGLQRPMGGMGGVSEHMSRMETLEGEQLALLRELQCD